MAYIIDTTLRDGEQAPGIVFTTDERKRIAEMLVKTGVDEIEAGMPIVGDEEIAFLRWCCDLPLPVSCWCRAHVNDIEAAKCTGLSIVHISFPVSDRLLSVFNKDVVWLSEAMESMFELCQNDFERVHIGFMDASRADPFFVKQLLDRAAAIGYRRARIADSAGVMMPSDVIHACALYSASSIPVEFHPHNDFGMASANGITALDHGIDAVSATVLGIGERAGNARIEELAMVLSTRGGTGRHPFDMNAVEKLSRYVAKIGRRPIPVDRPIVGKHVFSHESGIHVAATIKDPESFLPLLPEKYGIGRVEIKTGRLSGSKGIQYVLRNMSVEIDLATAHSLLPMIRRIAEEKGRNLDPSEVEAIYHEYIINMQSV
jgi:homocitrate synthase NifV